MTITQFLNVRVQFLCLCVDTLVLAHYILRKWRNDWSRNLGNQENGIGTHPPSPNKPWLDQVMG
jgi:hypothetical protein